MGNRSISKIAVALLTMATLTTSVPRLSGAQSGGADGQSLAVARLAGTFETVLVGATPDGEGSVWEGDADGVAPGRVRLELKQVGPPSAAANPVWRVRARWILDAGEARSFVADLEGVVVWHPGLVRLAGTITSGWMAGARLEQEARIVDGDISGGLTIIR